jgi:hypothetical protein
VDAVEKAEEQKNRAEHEDVLGVFGKPESGTKTSWCSCGGCRSMLSRSPAAEPDSLTGSEEPNIEEPKERAAAAEAESRPQGNAPESEPKERAAAADSESSDSMAAAAAET